MTLKPEPETVRFTRAEIDEMTRRLRLFYGGYRYAAYPWMSDSDRIEQHERDVNFAAQAYIKIVDARPEQATRFAGMGVLAYMVGIVLGISIGFAIWGHS